MAKPEKHVFVCVQSRPQGHPRGSCMEKQAGDIMNEFLRLFEEKQLWGRFAVSNSGCLGTCGTGPSVLVYPEGVMYGGVRKEDVGAIVEEHLLGGEAVERLKVPAEVWS
jgi:(2Fe-2S) ferredoxin